MGGGGSKDFVIKEKVLLTTVTKLDPTYEAVQKDIIRLEEIRAGLQDSKYALLYLTNAYKVKGKEDTKIKEAFMVFFWALSADTNGKISTTKISGSTEDPFLAVPDMSNRSQPVLDLYYQINSFVKSACSSKEVNEIYKRLNLAKADSKKIAKTVKLDAKTENKNVPAAVKAVDFNNTLIPKIQNYVFTLKTLINLARPILRGMKIPQMLESKIDETGLEAVKLGLKDPKQIFDKFYKGPKLTDKESLVLERKLKAKPIPKQTLGSNAKSTNPQQNPVNNQASSQIPGDKNGQKNNSVPTNPNPTGSQIPGSTSQNLPTTGQTTNPNTNNTPINSGTNNVGQVGPKDSFFPGNQTQNNFQNSSVTNSLPNSIKPNEDDKYKMLPSFGPDKMMNQTPNQKGSTFDPNNFITSGLKTPAQSGAQSNNIINKNIRSPGLVIDGMDAENSFNLDYGDNHSPINIKTQNGNMNFNSGGPDQNPFTLPKTQNANYNLPNFGGSSTSGVANPFDINSVHQNFPTSGNDPFDNPKKSIIPWYQAEDVFDDQEERRMPSSKNVRDSNVLNHPSSKKKNYGNYV